VPEQPAPALDALIRLASGRGAACAAGVDPLPVPLALIPGWGSGTGTDCGAPTPAPRSPTNGPGIDADLPWSTKAEVQVSEDAAADAAEILVAATFLEVFPDAPPTGLVEVAVAGCWADAKD
jgi:hypothetical protein